MSQQPTDPHTDAVTALRHALRGVDLDHDDHRTLDWARRFLDVPTLRTFVRWVEQARQAERGALEADVTAALRGRSTP
jgi:hypothetical protein